jgi:hypothetical protein
LVGISKHIAVGTMQQQQQQDCGNNVWLTVANSIGMFCFAFCNGSMLLMEWHVVMPTHCLEDDITHQWVAACIAIST